MGLPVRLFELGFVAICFLFAGCGGNTPNTTHEGEAREGEIHEGETHEGETIVVDGNRLPKPGSLVVGEDDCVIDEDCVPKECCHPRHCTAKQKAPNCEGVMCTLNCIGTTMDCGGACLCHQGKCTARIAGPYITPNEEVDDRDGDGGVTD